MDYLSTVTMRLLGAFVSLYIQLSSFAVDNTIIAVEIIHNEQLGCLAWLNL
jgi:hypothetical protein